MAERKWPRGIRPHGNGIEIRIYWRGRYVWEETVEGDAYRASDIAAAVQRRDELRSRLKLGLPLYRGDATATRSLFIDDAQDYLNTLDADYSTHLSYEGILNKYWLPVFGNWPTLEISTQAIKEELARHKTISQKTKKNILVPLRGALQHAGINPNPVAAIKLKRHQKPRIQRYQPPEVQALLAELSGQEQVYFALLLGTGLRPGEALGLQWPDYNGEEISVTKQIVRRRTKATTKTHESRQVYVPTWCRPYLNKHPTRFQGGPIFVNSRGEHFRDCDVFNLAWRDAHRKARVPYRIPYTCRHTRAAELLSAGVEPGRAAAQLGHTLEMFFRTYSEWIDEYSRQIDKSLLEGSNGANAGQMRSPKSKKP